MLKIKTGDEVIVITGKYKGTKGTVLRKLKDGRLVVEGVNIVKKHTRPNPNQGIEGGIVEKEAPIQASNVAIYNPATKKADRVGFKLLEDGKKVRFFKSNDEVIDV